MQTLRQMKRFMEPQSVALVGISRDTGEWAFNILENLLSYGYQGRIYPINSNTSEILGIKTYSNVTEVTDDIDLAIIATPRSPVPSLVKECIDSNILSIVVVAQGFADASDDQGKQLQKQITEIVQNSPARLIGPNTLGTANAFIDFSSSFVKIEMKKEPIGIICQTGTFFVGFQDLRLMGKGVDLGNACDIDFADSLEYFESDPETKLVALHIEGIQDTERFINTARRVARIKPLLALKTGKSEQAAKAAQSHSGSLTGSNKVWEAAFKQSGVIQVGDLEEFVDLARTFSVLPLMKRPKIGVATFSGAMGVMVMDSCQQYNLELGRLSAKTKRLLHAISPPWLNVGNPADIWPAVANSRLFTKGTRQGLEALLSDNQLGAVLFICAPFDMKFTTELCQLLNELAATYRDKPLVGCLWGPYGDEAIKELQNAGKVAAFPTPERAVKALARLNEYSQFRRRL